MSKPNTFAAVLKFINGRNNNKEYLQGVYDYITDSAKTDNGNLVATHGCSKNHPLEDMLRNKLLHNKTHGKQGEHFVLALAPCGESKSPLEVLRVVKEIVSTIYPENMAIIAGHIDSVYLHFHVVLDAVNAVTGRKFSQSPSDLNRIKQKANNILKKNGFEIITASANDFVDHTDYTNEEGFAFLELNESEMISEHDIEEISTYTASIGLTNTPNLFCGWDYPSCDNNKYLGGNNMNNRNYTSYMPQTQAKPASTPKYEAIPSTVSTTQQVQELSVSAPSSLPTVQPAQEIAVPVTTTEAVPATVETAINCYPNTNVLTGPTFRIKGTPESNFAGFNELVEQTTAYAQEHQREAANLALAMQQYGQQNGYPSNVSVYAGPIFDIDLTGGMYPPMPSYDENKF
ncbi:MAG: relaxase/mobilization nuclease domain-containing protein [Ruminococcus sp.]|nr:relaxase/mobilization nuclease domain-containing protein [Ruminococcus sp.]